MKLGISLLALCGVAYALSTFPPANVAKIVDAQLYMGRNQTNIETEKRNLGTVYLCTAAFFSGYCVAITGGFNGGCIDLAADLNNQVSSFGPGEYLAPSPTSRRSHPMFPDPERFSQWLIIHRTVLTIAQLPAKAFLFGLGPSRSRASRISACWVDTTGFVNAPFNDIISSYMQALLVSRICKPLITILLQVHLGMRRTG
ncbi:hypothetical protein B0H13DRAFT_2325661 [Mycena leptocephala]|nr:hypothetical protein B0H13DRAFT_2325661 [Mycena leptocephala]